MKRHYKNGKPSDTNGKPIDTIRYRDKRVIANGYFSVFKNQFISFSERKRANRIYYDEKDFF